MTDFRTNQGSHKLAIIVDTSSMFLSVFDTLTALVCFNMACPVYLKFTLECCLLRQSHIYPRVYLTLELKWSSCHRPFRWGQILYWEVWWLCFTNYIYSNRAHSLSALTWSHLVTPQVRTVTSYAGVGQDRISVAVAFTVIKKKKNAHTHKCTQLKTNPKGQGSFRSQTTKRLWKAVSFNYAAK